MEFTHVSNLEEHLNQLRSFSAPVIQDLLVALQPRACLATYHGRDSLIDAGTGSGKTLPIALNLLLDDPRHKKISP
jgi:superfamily II DNA/RNA helicase